jgi:phosphoenolpyruvate synthase/pyruvate phosphate dikinase
MKHALTVKQSLLYTDLSVLGNARHYFSEVLGIDYELKNVRYLDGRISWNYDHDLAYNRALLSSRGLNDAIKLFISSLQRETAQLKKVADAISSQGSFSQLTVASLEGLFRRYIESYLRNMPFLFVFWNTEKLLTEQIERFDLPVLFEEDEINRVLYSVLIPSGMNYIAKERQSLLKIAFSLAKIPNLKESLFTTPLEEVLDLVQSDSLIDYLLSGHLDRFAFTSTAFHLNPPLSKVNVLQRVKEVISGDLDQVLSAEQQAKEEQQRNYEYWMNDLARFPDITARVKLLQDLLFWKNERIDIQFLSDYKVRGLFQELANRMSIELHELVFLTYQEIEHWLTTGASGIDKSTLQKRIKGYDYLVNEREVSISTEFELEESTDELSDVREIRGETANPGKAEGIVKVLAGMEDISKIQRGDILVTSMTRPEMIMALERAAAFVTDQGGRLCHAAIVSREMNKPCVIGTEIATRILKDGQRVRVDADEGVVRILD